MSLKSRLLTAFSVLAMIAVACATNQQNQPPGTGSSTVEELPAEQHEGQQGTAEAAPTTAATGPQLNAIGSPEDGFTAKMPGAPQVARNKVTTKAGDITTAAWT